MCGHVGVASVVNRLQAAKSIKKPECANLILGSSSYSLSCLLGVLVCNYVSSVGFPTLLKPTTKQIWGAASFSLRTRMNYSGYYQPDIPKSWATTVARVLFHTGANGTVHPCDLGPGWKSGAGSWGKFVQGHVEPKSMMHSAKKGLFLELQVQIALTFWRFLYVFYFDIFWPFVWGVNFMWYHELKIMKSWYNRTQAVLELGVPRLRYLDERPVFPVELGWAVPFQFGTCWCAHFGTCPSSSLVIELSGSLV